VTATAGTVTTTLTYDPLGRLFQVVQKTGTTTNSDTKFLYDGDAEVLEYNLSGAVTNRYVHGSNAAADDPLAWYSGATLGAIRYLHADHLGSIVGIANGSTGAPIANGANTDDEYGIPDSANNTVERFQYTGQAFLSELGMYYYKARMYSPRSESAPKAANARVQTPFLMGDQPHAMYRSGLLPSQPMSVPTDWCRFRT